MNPVLEKLGAVSAEYARQAQAFEGIAVEAAQAEAEHRRERAKAILAFKAERPSMSQAEAEARAEADDHVSGLYLRRVTTAALVNAALERLRQLRTQNETGRSAVAAEREADRMHAAGG